MAMVVTLSPARTGALEAVEVEAVDRRRNSLDLSPRNYRCFTSSSSAGTRTQPGFQMCGARCISG